MSNDNLPQPMNLHYERPHGMCVLEYYTADQVRQCQRDAVAAASGAGVDSLAPGSPFMVNMDSVLRMAESHEGGRISTKVVWNWIENYQGLLLAAAPTPDSDGAAARDTARLDRLEAWRLNSIAKGFDGDTFQLTVDRPIREQVDALQGQVGDALAAAPVGAVTDEDAEEAADILNALIENIERDGNYSQEATLCFLGQLKQCVDGLIAKRAGSAT